MNSSSFYILIIGLLASFRINESLSIAPLEIVSILTIPINILTKKNFIKNISNSFSYYSTISYLLGFWFIIQILSDIINQTDLVSMIKGSGTPCFAWVSLTYLLNIIKTRKLDPHSVLKYYIAGFAINFLILSYSLYIGENATGFDFWKLGGFLGFSLLILCFVKNINLQIIGMLIMSITGLIDGSRGILIISFSWIGVMIYKKLFEPKSEKYLDSGLLNRGLIKTIAGGLIIITIWTAFTLYAGNISTYFSNSISMLTLNQNRKEVLKQQASGKLGLLGFRSEYITYAFSIPDAPLFGHGSWAKDETGQYTILHETFLQVNGIAKETDIRQKIGNKLVFYNRDEPWIPKHSHLFGTMVWCGVFGGLFWFYIFRKSIRLLLNNFKKNNGLYTLILIQILWNILYSPLGYNTRWFLVIALLVIVVTGKKNDSFMDKISH